MPDNSMHRGIMDDPDRPSIMMATVYRLSEGQKSMGTSCRSYTIPDCQKTECINMKTTLNVPVTWRTLNAPNAGPTHSRKLPGSCHHGIYTPKVQTLYNVPAV